MTTYDGALRLRSGTPLLAAALTAFACSTGNSGPTQSTESPATTSIGTESSSTAGVVSNGPTTTSPATPSASAAGSNVMPASGQTMAPPPATSSAAPSSSDTAGHATDETSAAIDPSSDVSLGVDTAPAETNASNPDDTGAGTSGSTIDESGDLIAPRALSVTAPPARHEHRFRAKDADAAVSFNDNDQIAIFDNRAVKLMGKLVLTFGGAGETKGNLTGGGEFTAKRGFHVLAVAAFQAYNIVDYGPDFFGLARRTVFEGVMHTKQDAFATSTLTPADGVAQRTQKALEYLHALYPEEDWGYFLQADGSVRWSDVIFTGVSHGASNSARFASLVRASRVVAVAGPRDNLCARADVADCGGEVATWYDEEPKTPIDRYYTITGVGDDQHTQHLFAMEKLGYVGAPARVDNAQPPYGNSHRLIHGGGHDDVCANQNFQNVCNYAFGVPSENHAGTQ